MKWDAEAHKALQNVPFIVRPLARGKIEESVRRAGRDVVTLADYEECYRQFRRAFAGKKDSDLKHALPASRDDRPAMVLVESCPGEVRGCQHLLIPVTQWADELEAALEGIRFSERLLERLEEESVLLHHKFRVSVSGCPNCCSQPQIKDFGVHGQQEPAYLSGCTQCGLCVNACPDSCLSLGDGPEVDPDVCLSCGDCVRACPVPDCLVAGRSGARILMGGKLGRRPRLAQPVADFVSLDEAKEALVEIAEAYLESSAKGERVADWMRRVSFTPRTLSM
ncbi:MAG: hypothetical protein KatS3mg024_1617 [Armatimonadota bacterium]|nr:MAG: hypothetical protein KatS3mg024_1617 [Armatimonadota bacterium]